MLLKSKFLEGFFFSNIYFNLLRGHRAQRALYLTNQVDFVELNRIHFCDVMILPVLPSPVELATLTKHHLAYNLPNLHAWPFGSLLLPQVGSPAVKIFLFPVDSSRMCTLLCSQLINIPPTFKVSRAKCMFFSTVCSVLTICHTLGGRMAESRWRTKLYSLTITKFTVTKKNHQMQSKKLRT